MYFKKNLKSLLLFVVLTLLVTGNSCTQEHKHQNNNEQKKQNPGSSIVHEGVIDLNVIDENKDGKVFQDLMDWNVISDKPGECPLCRMELEEVSINKAKENLVEHGFKVLDK